MNKFILQAHLFKSKVAMNNINTIDKLPLYYVFQINLAWNVTYITNLI